MNGLSQHWWMQAGRGSLPDDRRALARQDRRELGPRRFAVASERALWKSLDRKDFRSAARFSVFDTFLV
jgi:hypothetical protein